MAKESTPDDLKTLLSSKVKKIIIRNFRSIGPNPVEIDLDDIVVIVGPNNAGKSTVLRAYEVVMSHEKLTIEDFPKEQVDAENLPEIELQTFVWDNLPGADWLHDDSETGRKFIRERWIWDGPNKEPKRQGAKASSSEWDDKVPWGAPNVAKAYRPVPHRVDAFASPEEQGTGIGKIIQDILIDKLSSPIEGEKSSLEELSEKIVELQKKVAESSIGEIVDIQDQLSLYVSQIFIGFQVLLDLKTEKAPEKTAIFAEKPIIRMGPTGGHLAPLDRQGSGARRTLLWSALKIAAERKPSKKAAKGKQADQKESEKPNKAHVLLLDEPEICLHPSSIREACRVLYDLAAGGAGWQVMVTTHSPVFIDLSRDNTTIVRIVRMEGGDIFGQTVFRPDRAHLTPDDKELLKILNQWDPYVAEFFFGGRTIVVEGDTEYSAFKEIISKNPDLNDVHIVRARGKFIIPTLVKILNQFGANFSILHDSDAPLTEKGAANPAWAANAQILELCKASAGSTKNRLIASIFDFERAIFGEPHTKDKPYNAVRRLRSDPEAAKNVEMLLRYLAFKGESLPPGFSEYNSVDDLSAKLAPQA